MAISLTDTDVICASARRNGLGRYRCHKVVHAGEIDVVWPYGELSVRDDDGGHVAKSVSPTWLEKHDPKPGDWFVVYEDGYCSVSPAAAFRDGYVREDVPPVKFDEAALGAIRGDATQAAAMQAEGSGVAARGVGYGETMSAGPAAAWCGPQEGAPLPQMASPNERDDVSAARAVAARDRLAVELRLTAHLTAECGRLAGRVAELEREVAKRSAELFEVRTALGNEARKAMALSEQVAQAHGREAVIREAVLHGERARIHAVVRHLEMLWPPSRREGFLSALRDRIGD